jgi:pyrroline-5-carboxylate reductase
MTIAATDDFFTHLEGDVLLAGAGKMGGAMLAGWLARGLPLARAAVIEPTPGEDIRALGRKGLRLNPAADEIAALAALVIAVKPQTFADASAALRGFIGSNTLIVSIMAGKTIAAITQACGGTVVRAMPNTPAAIGRGMTVAVAARDVSDAQRIIADRLLAATGSVEWVADEALMDAVTAVSGSGPAYVFLLAEELAHAGVAAGLPAALAMRLARETIAGSGELMHRAADEPAKLRQNVTSPGGTTAAALEVLMGEDGLRQLMTRAVAAATRRSRELAG